jgi:ribonuclease I
MMSKHGGDKNRQSQATPPRREGEKAGPGNSGGTGQRTGAVPKSPASQASPTSSTVPTHEQIAVRAYENWEARGRPAGTDQEDWFEADRQLQAAIKYPSLERVPDKGTNRAEIGKHKL